MTGIISSNDCNRGTIGVVNKNFEQNNNNLCTVFVGHNGALLTTNSTMDSPNGVSSLGDRKSSPHLSTNGSNISNGINSASDARNNNGGKESTMHKMTRRNKFDPRYVDVIRERPIRVTAKVLVPVREHPKFNFVGKLLGPKGNSMKRLQEETLTKMAVLGKGSMRDKQKEEDLRASGDPKYMHLLEDLHVEITAFAPPAEAHARLAYSLAEIRRYLVPDNNDDIRRQQMREMEYMGDCKEGGSASSLVPTKDSGGGSDGMMNGGGGAARGDLDNSRPLSPLDHLRTDPGSPGSSSIPPILPPLHHSHLSSIPPNPHHRSRSTHSLPPHPHDMPLNGNNRLLPPWGCSGSRRRVLSILDKAKMALDSSYEDDGYPEYFYGEYDDYNGREDYPDLYPMDCYDNGRWTRYKSVIPTVPRGGERARCRSSPYSRPQ